MKAKNRSGAGQSAGSDASGPRCRSLSRGGLGAVYKLKNSVELNARYDLEYRESFLNQTASVKVRWAF